MHVTNLSNKNVNIVQTRSSLIKTGLHSENIGTSVANIGPKLTNTGQNRRDIGRKWPTSVALGSSADIGRGLTDAASSPPAQSRFGGPCHVARNPRWDTRDVQRMPGGQHNNGTFRRKHNEEVGCCGESTWPRGFATWACPGNTRQGLPRPTPLRNVVSFCGTLRIMSCSDIAPPLRRANAPDIPLCLHPNLNYVRPTPARVLDGGPDSPRRPYDQFL